MYLIGSKLLGINNNKDIDILEIVDGKNIYKREYSNNVDKLLISEDRILKTLKFQCLDWKEQAYQMFNYQYDQTLRKHFGHDDFPIKYNILDYKEELITFLNYIKTNKLWNYNTKIHGKNNTIFKGLYHIAYNKFILLNNSPILTEEQQEFVQRIHDKEVTWDEYIKKVGY